MRDSSPFAVRYVRAAGRVSTAARFSGLPLYTALLALALTAGCGSKKSDPTQTPPPPVSVEIVAPASTTMMSGTYTIALRVTHQVVGNCTLDLKYSTNGGATRLVPTENTGVTSNGLGPYSAAPGGIIRVYAWDTIADLGVGLTPNVTLYATVTDDASVSSLESSVTATVDNSSPPTTAVSTPGVIVSGNHAIAYTLTDLQSDTASIVAQFSINGGSSFAAATLATGAPEGTTGLTTSPGGIAHTFLWDSAADVPGATTTQARFRITASDSAAGPAGTTTNFTVDNTQTPPSATVTTPSGTVSGLVVMSYRLIDAQSNPCSITVEFSTTAALLPPPPNHFESIAGAALATRAFPGGASIPILCPSHRKGRRRRLASRWD
jgi:hypothetical protein